jgi:hypothetical protein
MWSCVYQDGLGQSRLKAMNEIDDVSLGMIDGREYLHACLGNMKQFASIRIEIVLQGK